MKRLRGLFGSSSQLSTNSSENQPSVQDPKPPSLPDASSFKASMNSLDQDPAIIPFQKQNYRFQKKIGAGSYAVVKEAIHVPTQTRVAIKMIDKSRMRNREHRLRDEIEILLKVKHPNLLSLLDWGFGRSTVYLVTELAVGGELFQRIIDLGVFYEQDAATIVYSLLDAVSYLHDLDIIHRDIKPENIFMRDPTHKDYSTILLGDYGIAKMLHSNRRYLRTKIGSPGYMAPEVLMNHPYGKPADVWSVGVIAYILLSGSMPWRGSGDFNAELDAILQHPLSFDDHIWMSISDQAKHFVYHCLNVDPQQRFTAQEAISHPWLQYYATQRPKSTDQVLDKYDLFPSLKEGIDAEKAYYLDDELMERADSRDSNATSGFGSSISTPSNKSVDNFAI